MIRTTRFSLLFISLLLLPLFGQQPASPALQPAPADTTSGKEPMIQPQYRQANLDLLLQEIGSLTGKVILRDPQVPDVSITLMSRTPIPVSEFLKAAESILEMNNIALVPFRDQFLRVVPTAGVERDGAPLILEEELVDEDDEQIVSQIIQLEHLTVQEIQTLVTQRLSQTASVQVLERRNAFLLTDTRSNIGRIQKVLSLLDRPSEARETVKIYQLVHAPASEIKTRLDALVQQSQQLDTPQTSANWRRDIRLPRGAIRSRQRTEETAGTSEADATATSSNLIQGSVQILADDRTNVLIIISRKENHDFFAEMIEALDKKVEPDVGVRIYSLQFANASEASSTLNELIGAASSSENPSLSQEVVDSATEDRRGQSIRDFIRQQNREQRQQTPTESNTTGTVRLGSETRILADERTNSLILMGKKEDLDVLERVIEQLDVMLAQVAIRAVIMEVTLTDNLSYGIDWLQQSLTANSVENINGVAIRESVLSFGGGQNLSSDSTAFRDAATINREIQLAPGSLSYFVSLYDFNLDAVLRLAQGNSEAKVIATPIIVTTDNKEASIRVGERRAIPTTTATTIGGSVQSSFEYENIGLNLSVTPRINPRGTVIMELNQTAENVGGTTTIDGNDVPIITSRELEASVSIQSGGTLVLGGMVREDVRESQTKVPLLGSIPILGHLFRSTRNENIRTELLVLISPEVLVTPEEAEKLTYELKKGTELERADWYRGWELPARSEWGRDMEPAAESEAQADAPE
jgi:general secretion pathway protein D